MLNILANVVVIMIMVLLVLMATVSHIQDRRERAFILAELRALINKGQAR